MTGNPAKQEAAGRDVRFAGVELACLLLLALTGGAVQALSSNLRFQNADSFVPVFVSLYAWTPFFWDQDRFGMLVPLLALPFREPFWNLVAQQVLRSAATLAAPLALAGALAPRPYRLAAGLLTLGTWLAYQSQPSFAVASFQPYPVAICLGCLGVVALEAKSAGMRALGAFSTLLAVWVAPTVGLCTLPVAAVRSLLSRPDATWSSIWRDRRGLVLSSIGSVVLVQALASHWPGVSRPTRLVLVSFESWSLGFATFVLRWTEMLSPWLVGLDCLLVVVVAARYFTARSERNRRLLILAVGPLATAALEAAVLGAIWWFHGNGLSSRYVAVGTLLVCLQPFLVLSELLRAARFGEILASARVTLVGCAIGLGGLLAWFGPPSLAGARRVLDTYMNRSIADAVLAVNESGCSHLLGEYWRVFPVTFAANVLRSEGGGTADPVWPLSGSSRMVREAWEPADWGKARVCVLSRDPKWREMAEHVGLTPTADGVESVRLIFLSADVGLPGSAAFGPRLR